MGYEVKFSKDNLEIIKRYIKNKVDDAGADGVVFGLSGGLDSAVVLKICTLLFEPDKITALFLPESTTPDQDTFDAHSIAKECGVGLVEIGIDQILQSFIEEAMVIEPDPTSIGNLKARIRMNIIYLLANTKNQLVLGTSNKSELLLGYFTKFGDGGSDVAPLGDLYKTQVRELARLLEMPDSIISKPPTAGLVQGQTDEGELGLDYGTIDKILFGLERNISTSRLAKGLGLKEKKIVNLKTRVERNRHKRKFPKIPKIGLKTIGVDLYE